MGGMAMTEAEKKIKKIAKKTTEDMTALGTYRVQFEPAIRMYAQMRYQYEELSREFFDTGSKVTEEYTNKAGATNERKTALYSAIEQLRRDIAQQEDRLGLSPSGMKRINEAEMKSRKKTSKLTNALDKLGR
ncbi:MAG: P27 family phage terminase small subunit [Eubacteriales bacterium]